MHANNNGKKSCGHREQQREPRYGLRKKVKKIFDSHEDKDSLSFKVIKKLLVEDISRSLSKPETEKIKELVVNLYIEFKEKSKDQNDDLKEDKPEAIEPEPEPEPEPEVEVKVSKKRARSVESSSDETKPISDEKPKNNKKSKIDEAEVKEKIQKKI